MADRSFSLLAGIDIPIVELQVNIHQPYLKEIAYIGEEEFFSAVQFLCITKNKFEENPYILQMSNFDLLMNVIENSENKSKRKKHLVNLLTILFPDYSPLFSVNSIILKEKNTSKTVIIDSQTFDILQPVFKEIFCINLDINKENSYNPANKAAQKIMDKIMKGRQKVAEQRGESDKSVLAKYVSIIAVALNMPIKEVLDLTLFQLYDLIERFDLYTRWDLDLKVRLAGGKPDEDAEKKDWMKNIH